MYCYDDTEILAKGTRGGNFAWIPGARGTRGGILPASALGTRGGIFYGSRFQMYAGWDSQIDAGWEFGSDPDFKCTRGGILKSTRGGNLAQIPKSHPASSGASKHPSRRASVSFPLTQSRAEQSTR